MKKTLHIYLDERFTSARRAVRTLRLEYFDDTRPATSRSIFFDVEGATAAVPIMSLDFAVQAMLFSAMRWGRTIHAHGPVSRTLLANLEEFQRAFAAWFPDLYQPVEVIPDSYSLASQRAGRAVVAFSGGVDACFTALRHLRKTPGHYHVDVRTAMLVQGMDIPLGADDAFRVAEEGAHAILDGEECEVAIVRTDAKKLLVDWQHNFGALLAACLNQFASTHSIGLMGSDEPYQDLVLPWGSNPVTNPLLSSDSMQIVTDGAGYTRTQKIKHIANWPAAVRSLRVCWEGPVSGGNCGRCEKCIRTILNFRAVGAPLPAAFARDITDEEIASVNLRNAVQVAYMWDILAQAERNGIASSWVEALRQRLGRPERVAA